MHRLLPLLLLAGCTSIEMDPETGRFTVHRFAAKVGVGVTKTCPAPASPDIAAEMLKFSPDQLSALCNVIANYSSEGDPATMALAQGLVTLAVTPKPPVP